MGINSIKFLTIALLFVGTCKASSVFIIYGQDALNDIDSNIGQMNDDDYFTYHLGQMNKENSKTINLDEKNKMDDVELIKADHLDDSSTENKISANWNQIFHKKYDEDDYFQLSKNIDKDVEMLPDNFDLEKKTDLINEIDTEINLNNQLNKNLFQFSKPIQHVYQVGPYQIQMQISFYGGNLNDIGNMNANEININRLFNEFGTKPDPVIDQFIPEIYEEKTVTYQFDPEIYGGNTDRNEGNTETYQIDQEINEDNTENYSSDEVEIFGGTTEKQYGVDPEINGGNTETYDTNTDTYQVDPEINEDNTENYDEVEIFGVTTEPQYEVEPEINGGNTETYDSNTDTYQVNPEINEDNTEQEYEDYYQVTSKYNLVWFNTENYGNDEVEIFGGTTEQQYEVDPEINGGNTETYVSNTDTYQVDETNKFDPASYEYFEEDYNLN